MYLDLALSKTPVTSRVKPCVILKPFTPRVKYPILTMTMTVAYVVMMPNKHLNPDKQTNMTVEDHEGQRISPGNKSELYNLQATRCLLKIKSQTQVSMTNKKYQYMIFFSFDTSFWIFFAILCIRICQGKVCPNRNWASQKAFTVYLRFP